MEFKKIPIICPKCKGVAFHYNGITKMPITSRCMKCGVVVTFIPEKELTKLSKYQPQRAESSGKRFY